MQNLEGFNYEDTKKNINDYFKHMENLEWEWSKLNAQKGLVANYDFTTENRKPSHLQIGRDIFNLSAKQLKEEELREYIANYQWATSILSDVEQLYLMEHFINNKYEKEIIDLLGFNNRDSNEFKRLKRSAVYKFADFLNILVENGNRKNG